MPIQITKTVTALELRYADHVIDCPNRNAKGQSVQVTRRGTKKIHVGFSDGKFREFDADAVFTVWRNEPTEAEKEAEIRETYLHGMERTLSSLLAHDPGPLAAAAVEGTYLDSWAVGQLLTAQERKRAGHYVADNAKAYEDAGATRYDALMGAFGALAASRGRRTTPDPLSRSTSTLSNLQEDLRRHVAEEAVNDALGWTRLTQTDLLAAHDACVALVREQRESEKVSA